MAQQSTEHALALLDAEGRFTWWSSGAERIFGYAAADIVGQDLDIIFTPEDRERAVPAHERAIACAQGVAHDDRWQMRADGTRVWVSGALVRLTREDGTVEGFGKLMRDRTDIKEQLESMRNELRAREQESRRKDVFLSTLSHELRNPMAPLSNAVGIIRMGGHLDTGMEYAVRVIERQVELLRRLVDDLLDLTRIGAGKIELRRGRIALQSVLRTALEMAHDAIASRNHRVESLFPSTPIEVDADPDRMAQVFVNLLTNAAKYTPPRGVIDVTALIEGGEAVVRVSDNGVGIAPDVLPRIFEMFTQAEGASVVAPGGLGIGLALVRDLVRQHGGSVQARSDGLGKGSEFTVRLPLAPPPPSASSPR